MPSTARIAAQRLPSACSPSPGSNHWPVATDVNTLVRSMEQLLRRIIGEAVRFEFVLAADIWATRVDTGQLESAILNLAVNARDAMPEGGRLTVETLNTHLDDSYAATHPAGT